MAKRLTSFQNGLQIGTGDNGGNGLLMKLETSEPSGNIDSQGRAYSSLVTAGGTYGSLWMESDGIHYNTNGTEYTVPLTSTSGSNSLDIAYDVGSAVTVDGGAIALTDPSTGSTNTLEITKSSTNTGDAINIDLDAGVGATALTIDAGGGARTAALNVIGLDGTFDSAAGGTIFDINISQTGAAASSAFDIDVSSIYTGSIFDVALGAAATTGYVLNVDFNAGVAYGGIYFDAGAATRTVDLIDVKFDGDGDVSVLDIDATNTGSGNLIDIAVDAIHTGNALSVVYGTAAATGDAISIDMGTNIAGGAIVLAAAGARTDSLIDIADASTGNAGLIKVATTGIYTGNILELSCNTAAATGNIIDIDCDANLAGYGIYVDAGAGTRTEDLVGLKLDGDGNISALEIDVDNIGSGAIIDINVDTVHTGNALDITYGTAAATGNGIDINMGTNVAGMALSIGSAATGTASEGAAIDIAHTGNLGANADLVRIVSTGSHNAASNLLYVEASTGASNVGTYAVNINATGTNVEALKVDAGAVVFDETLSVGGNTSMTGTLTVGVNDTGHDVKFYGATDGAYCLWDESADDLKLVGAAGLTVAGATTFTGTVTTGVNDTGVDVKFYGATDGAYMLWDESADDLILAGAAGLSVAGATTLTGLVTCAAGLRCSAVARTATADGLTTGAVAAGTSFVDVTTDSADKVISLPQGALGDVILMFENSATGFEIRPKPGDKANTTMNGGDCSSDEEIAIGAGQIARCICTKGGAAGNWTVSIIDTDGDIVAGGTPD